MGVRDISRIKRRMYRVLYREAQAFNSPVDPRYSEANFSEWLATFTELGICEDKNISSRIEPAAKINLDSGKVKAVSFKGIFEGKLLQSEIADLEMIRYIEGRETDFLLYSEKSNLCIFYPKALMDFKEEAKSGEVERVDFSYENSEVNSKDDFRIRFNSATGAGGPQFFFVPQSTTGTYNPGNLLGGSGSLRPNSVFNQPVLYYHKGTHERFYLAFCTPSGNPNSPDDAVYVDAYNIADNSFVGHLDLGPGTSLNETHQAPAVIVADSGHVIVAYDQLGGSGGHNGGIRIMRSDSPEDISSFTQVAVLGSERSDDGAYPVLWKLPSGRIICNYRGGPDVQQQMRSVSYSDDNGATWANAFTLLDTGDPSIWAYACRIAGSRGDIVLTLNPLDKRYAADRYLDVYILRSSDGITWRNEQNTFSRNLQSGAAFSKAELDQHFRAAHIDYAGTAQVISRTGGISPSGITYFIMRERADGASVYDWYLCYYSATQLIKKKLPFAIPGSSYFEVFIVYDDNSFDFIITNEDSERVERYRTTDRGDSWEKLENLADLSGTNYVYLYSSMNFPDGDYCLIWNEDSPSADSYKTFDYWLLKRDA